MGRELRELNWIIINNMFVIKFRKLFVTISAVLVTLSIISIAYFGIDFGIDFRGGALLEVSYSSERPTVDIVEENLVSTGLDLGSVLIQPISTDSFSIKTKEITEAEKIKSCKRSVKA